MGALSVTGTEHYREPFEPLIGGVKFADFNDLGQRQRRRLQTKHVQSLQKLYRAKAEFIRRRKNFLKGSAHCVTKRHHSDF